MEPTKPPVDTSRLAQALEYLDSLGGPKDIKEGILAMQERRAPSGGMPMAQQERSGGRDWRYYAGPHLSKSLDNLGGLASALINYVGPGADIKGMVDDSVETIEALRSGDYPSAAANFGMAAAALPMMFLPGTVGGVKEGVKEGVKGVKNVVKGADELPMDEASRMARAKEMGFDTDAYHGTPAVDIGEFRGPITWVSKQPKLASDYATVKSARDWTSDQRGTVYPLKAKTGRTLDLSSLDANDKVTYSAFFKKAGVEFAPDKYTSVEVDGIPQKFKAWNIINTPEFADAARTAGFESVAIKEGGVQTLGILDPKNIRSRFAAFDPAKKDSANILASLLAAGVVSAGAADKEFE